VSPRSIQYGRATDQEGFNPLVWSTLWFDGQFVSNLRRDIANALGEHDELNVTLCVRGGSQGRLTPLVTDLPGDEQAMEIVVFTTGSQGESLAVLSVACAAAVICFSSNGRCSLDRTDENRADTLPLNLPTVLSVACAAIVIFFSSLNSLACSCMSDV
jgi:hypothetical protein